MDILIKNSAESMRIAEASLNTLSSPLWTIVCSYYAMYYYTNAVLLKFGYNVTFNEFDGGHTLDNKVIEEIGKWINR